MMDLERTFQRPNQTLDWAWEAIDEFESALKLFFKDNPHGNTIEKDPETGHDIYKAILVRPFPKPLPRKATEALNNIRHSFDQILHAGCTAIRKPPKNDIHFPWRNDPTDLRRWLQSPKKEVPTELWDVIISQEPYFTGEGYAGGNDVIRELAKLANRKHTVGLALIGRVSSWVQPDVSGATYMRIPEHKWNPEKNEMILAIVSSGAKVDIKYNLAFNVFFDVTGLLSNISVLPALKAFAIQADGFAHLLRARCAEVLS